MILEYRDPSGGVPFVLLYNLRAGTGRVDSFFSPFGSCSAFCSVRRPIGGTRALSDLWKEVASRRTFVKK